MIVSTKPSIKVTFVDYGNQEIVTEVRDLPINVQKEPPFAYLIKINCESDTKIQIGARFDINPVMKVPCIYYPY